MSAWAPGAWASGAWAGTAWQEAAPVTVPDVVGQTQGDATTAIEAEGLVVAVAIAYSNTVPAGEVISQEPLAGTEVSAGSTVTITVSLGDQPVPDTSGGWDWGTLNERRRRTKKELLDERIALGILPPQEAEKVESLPPPVKAKVKKAGTITLRALIGTQTAEAMSTEALQAELDRIEARTRAERHRARLRREDEELLLM